MKLRDLLKSNSVNDGTRLLLESIMINEWKVKFEKLIATF